MYYVYAIQSQKNSRIYVGLTSDLEKRLTEHNKGKTRSTKFYIPWKNIYFEVCNDRIEARKREKYWKSGIGKEKLKKMAP
jgi:putative endonuclease